MKTLRITLIALVSLFVMASCSKKSDEINPANLPAPSAELAGAYTVTQYRIGNDPLQNLPNGRKIVIKFGYVTDNKVLLLVNDNTSSDPTIDTEYGNVDVVRVGRAIEIRLGTSKIGSYDNGTVEVEFEQSNGKVRFTGKRQ